MAIHSVQKIAHALVLLDTGGNGCETCIYNKNNKKYDCLKCHNLYNNYSYINYAYINNTHQCLDNTNSNQSDLYGCLKANYNQESKKYECYQWKDHFISVKN